MDHDWIFKIEALNFLEEVNRIRGLNKDNVDDQPIWKPEYQQLHWAQKPKLGIYYNKNGDQILNFNTDYEHYIKHH